MLSPSSLERVLLLSSLLNYSNKQHIKSEYIVRALVVFALVIRPFTRSLKPATNEITISEAQKSFQSDVLRKTISVKSPLSTDDASPLESSHSVQNFPYLFQLPERAHFTDTVLPSSHATTSFANLMLPSPLIKSLQ